MKKVLVIGSGPIVIGQSAEFDYSGTQACTALREEGLKVVLVNSNPATIQTDPEIADRTYIEPLNVSVLEQVIALEKPEGILATVGGQTALNLAMELHKNGVLKKYHVKFLGTAAQAIERAESREEFVKTMKKANVATLPGKVVKNIEEGLGFARDINYPIVIRPSYTLGGTGGGIAHNESELKNILSSALRLSATHEALLEKSVIGWGEFEYEVIRDSHDNAAIICNMENIDPMGIHTGESMVVAPSQTLSDRDHQAMRSASLRIVREIGIEGSCNVQYAFNQDTGELAVIEVNPRLSRSSALASKATGYPIARVAAKIALGKRLPEIKNAITGTSAAFEPALDYVVTKIPRWPFDKFRLVDRTIGTQMKSTGEVMAIGRTVEESLLKAIRSVEIKIPKIENPEDHFSPATDSRLFAIFEALRRGESIETIYKKTGIHRWFLKKMQNIILMEKKLASEALNAPLLLQAKRMGFPDKQIAQIKGMAEEEICKMRKAQAIQPVYKMVDSCAGEFEALTPYYYSTYEQENEARPTNKRKVIVLGSGPIRIGQGIEFDYCCSHASFALREMGIESIVVNNNPETVSTDFDSSDKLYFEPLTPEDVMHIIENEKPDGVIVQLGGQTSLNLAETLEKNNVKILGTGYAGIDLAEDRKQFSELATKLGIPQPPNRTATSEEKALEMAKQVGYPIVVRPSYVIAGRAMAIVHDEKELKEYVREAVDVSERKPVLIDKYLEEAIECEVDALCDGEEIFIGAIMEHIEYAGVHSGDANIVIPTIHLKEKEIETIKNYTEKIALALKTIGLINIQFAVKEGVVYILEANPRASRTVPFVSKAIGIPLAKWATQIMLGKKIKELKLKSQKISNFAVKSIVFPFLKLKGADVLLGPEMKSTGETMGIGSSFEMAYYKALLATGLEIRPKGYALLSLNDETKPYAKGLEGMLRSLDFKISATPGTGKLLNKCKIVEKIRKGSPDLLEFIEKEDVSLVINTPKRGGKSHTDGFHIRRACIEKGIPCFTNVQTLFELLKAMQRMQKQPLEIRELKEYWPK